MGGYSWGGSEELWAQAASMLVKKNTNAVYVCVKKWPKQHPRITRLAAEGAKIYYWTDHKSLVARVLNRFLPSNEFQEILQTVDPHIVVNSNGANFPGVQIAKSLINCRKPYVTICQANSPEFFCSDDSAEIYRCYFERAFLNTFVANANLNLLESQLGIRIPNAKVVQNPVGISMNGATFPIPLRKSAVVARFACVARLHPPSKGQDLLLSALSSPKWKQRQWTLDFYGDGPQASTLQRLVGLRGLQDRVSFRGHASEMCDVWREHDVLLLPSRYEGTPLVAIEAMLSGRPVMATDVGDTAVLVDEGVNGFLAEAPTVTFIDAALERMWQARSSWPQMGQSAHKKVSAWLVGDPGEALADLILQNSV